MSLFVCCFTRDSDFVQRSLNDCLIPFRVTDSAMLLNLEHPVLLILE